MKIVRFSIIFLSVFLAVGCKKDISLDTRNKYLGEYYFTIHTTSFWGFQGNTGSFDTTYFENATILKGNSDSTILISFASGVIKEFALREDGSIVDGWYECNGKFETNRKLKFGCAYYSPGSHSSNAYIGEKK